ncbi:hypothetical protein HID58_029434 [Brassica napus]|uniref:Uncharacterized protein n=1 Tax=Brassica napus TaxID=3708 RepID=A0ABQ8CD66_BRANA|nr:hypothetical protein HID58_029434 [Brassica napus]
MAVDDPLKPVVATKEAKPNYVEHLIGPGDDAEEGEIVDGDVDKSGNPQFLNRIHDLGKLLRSAFTFSTVEEFWRLVL